MNIDVLIEARNLLENITPLKTDCGLLCDHACCRDIEGDEAGMLLFPGEDALLSDEEKVKIRHEGTRNVYICGGLCLREHRPLACRIFPLTPVRSESGKWIVKLDRRAWAMCPLMDYGLNGLNKEFINESVRAIRKIAKEPDGEAFLIDWEQEERCAEIERLISVP